MRKQQSHEVSSELELQALLDATVRYDTGRIVIMTTRP